MIARIDEIKLVSTRSSGGVKPTTTRLETGYEIKVQYNKDEKISPEMIYKNVLLSLAKQLEEQNYILPVWVDMKL